MTEKFKNSAWIIFGGYGVGLIVRQGWDSVRGLPSLVDASLIDLGAILYGGSLIFLILWAGLTVIAIIERKPWAEAREHWEKCHPQKNGKFKLLWLLCRWQNTFLAYLSFRFVIAYLFCIAVSGDFEGGVKIFIGWSLLTLLAWFLLFGAEKKLFTDDSEIFERNVVRILDLPSERGELIVLVITMALIFGAPLYPIVSQSFGGGKPEQVVVFLKQGTTAFLPSGESVDGKTIDLIFRKGNKFGFRAVNAKDNRIVIIDQEKIDRLYIDMYVDFR